MAASKILGEEKATNMDTAGAVGGDAEEGKAGSEEEG